MPKVGGRRKKSRTHKENDEDTLAGEIPKCFIFRRGSIKRPMKQILKDYREVMYPNTSMKLKESENVKIKDYVKSSSVYGISHMIVFTSTEKSNYMKVIKNPEGPTITFKILKYSDTMDVIRSQRNPKSFSRDFSQPLLILSGFNQNVSEENKEPKELVENAKENKPTVQNYSLVSLMIQSMFPPLNIAKSNVNQLKRVALFDLDKERDVVHFRHYHIRTVPTNINRNLKKVLKMNKIPDLSQYNDISEFFLRNASGYASESEGEEIPDSKIELNEKRSGVYGKQKYSIRLHEIGPRLELKLMKIEEGLLKGNIFFNRIVKKEKSEILSLSKKIRQKQLEKDKRKRNQQKIVNQKNRLKNEKEKERQIKKEEKKLKKQAISEETEEGKVMGESSENVDYVTPANQNLKRASKEDLENTEVAPKNKKKIKLSKNEN